MPRHYRFSCIEGHTAGMPVRMVIGGAPLLNGGTMGERREEFIREYDWVRRALMLEPRGHGHMSGSLLYPALDKYSDCSLLFIETSGCLPMCGHATLGSITFGLEAGLINPRIKGHVVVDVPAGRIHARYWQDGDKITSVRFSNVPSFLLHQNIKVEFPPLGTLHLDIAYGGNFYPIVEVQSNFPGFEHFSLDQLLRWGSALQTKINAEFEIVHPEDPKIHGIKHCMWTGAPKAQTSRGRAVVIAGDTLIDRSPCGTGTSARVAQRYARGQLLPGEAYPHESVIGSRFIGRVEDTTYLANGWPAIIPSIEGSAFITGRSEFVVDERDPYWQGFELPDFRDVQPLVERAL